MLRKELDAPQAPFVIGTIGFDGWKMTGPHKIVAEAQLALGGERGKYPEFKGNVLTVETRDFWVSRTCPQRTKASTSIGNVHGKAPIDRRNRNRHHEHWGGRIDGCKSFSGNDFLSGRPPVALQ